MTANYTAGGVITGKEVMISNFKIFTLENSDPPALPFKMVFFDNVNGGNSQLLMSGTDLEDNRVFYGIMITFHGAQKPIQMEWLYALIAYGNIFGILKRKKKLPPWDLIFDQLRYVS